MAPAPAEAPPPPWRKYVHLAVLSTVLISAGTAHGHASTSSPDITGYRFAFLAAAMHNEVNVRWLVTQLRRSDALPPPEA